MKTGILASLIAAVLLGCSSPPPRRAPQGGVEHVVIIKWKDDVTPAKREELMAQFRGLQTQIPGIHSIEEGRDISTEKLQKDFNHAVIVTFEDQPHRDMYLTHPAHVAFKDKALPLVADLLVLDFVVSR